MQRGSLRPSKAQHAAIEASRTNGISICDLAGVLAQRLDTVDCPVNLLLPAVRLRYDPGNCPPVAGDDDGLAAFHVVEELGQMGFGLGGLNFAVIVSVDVGLPLRAIDHVRGIRNYFGRRIVE